MFHLQKHLKRRWASSLGLQNPHPTWEAQCNVERINRAGKKDRMVNMISREQAMISICGNEWKSCWNRWIAYELPKLGHHLTPVRFWGPERTIFPSFMVNIAPSRNADVLNTLIPICPALGTSYCAWNEEVRWYMSSKANKCCNVYKIFTSHVFSSTPPTNLNQAHRGKLKRLEGAWR